MKFKIVLFLIFILAIFGVGVYFEDEATSLYKSFEKEIENFKKIDVGNLIKQAEKQINLSQPLKIGGIDKQVVLLQSKIILETNLQRKKNVNLPPLLENIKLNETALAKAEDMFLNQYFEHISPTGVGPGDLAQKYGYDYIVQGENLILGNFSSEKELVQLWMDSPGHRANILNNRYTEIGVAIIKGIYEGETVWIGVQEFGLPLSSCQQPNEAFGNQIDYSKDQIDIIALQIDEKKREMDKTNPRSSAYKQMVEDYNNLVQRYNSLVNAVKEFINQYNTQVSNFNNCMAGK